jgi:hypothetical protein
MQLISFSKESPIVRASPLKFSGIAAASSCQFKLKRVVLWLLNFGQPSKLTCCSGDREHQGARGSCAAAAVLRTTFPVSPSESHKDRSAAAALPGPAEDIRSRECPVGLPSWRTGRGAAGLRSLPRTASRPPEGTL